MIFGEMPKKRDIEPSSLADGVTEPGAHWIRGKTLGPLTPPQFAEKWAGNTRTERAAAQEHFIDLCRMLGVQI